MKMVTKTEIIGVRVDQTSYIEAISKIALWAQNTESRYVCVANVHVVMEAHDSPEFSKIVNFADLVTPDGMPLVWSLRVLGARDQTRVYGPELTLRMIEVSAKKEIAVGFYGTGPGTLRHLTAIIKQRFPSLNITYSCSPPFRQLTAEEDQVIVEEMNAAGVRILFVGLGCPKQECWMAEHKGRVQAVMIGVGAAFDFLAGEKKQAPSWMQKNGLEWLYRLSQEPGRLWRRYLYNNPRFLALVLLQLLFKQK
jgi:N-acetylglucosaminyldiphosphoundecaprenol N-acetyl-beta-D-mannosaminyltransferase